PPAAPPRFDLPIRMLAGALLTLLVTAVASRVSEAWSGLLTASPVITLVLGICTHHQAGSSQVAQLFRGMAYGFYAFCGFFITLALLLPRIGLAGAFLAAIGVAVTVQATVARLLSRRRAGGGESMGARRSLPGECRVCAKLWFSRSPTDGFPPCPAL